MAARASALAITGLLIASSAVVLGVGPAPAAALPRVSFVAGPGASVLVHGTYPAAASSCVAPTQPVLHARYEGTIEVGKDDDGRLFAINVLPFEDYLKGIAEVPRTWHLQALEAQVVAARSYAAAHLGNPGATGERLGYDLCATDACQVYRGLGISAGPYGSRWERAVDATAGQVLVYQGRPADTVYFSTSKGHTVGNDQVFGSAPLPYLRPVTESDDGDSPLSHWRMAMPWSDVGRFLRAAGAWGPGPVSAVRRDGPNVVVTGGGDSATLALTDFRADLNAWAHCLDPATYPTIDTNGIRLPQTVPSKWFGTSSEGGSMVLTGRGWGHGVGMVQWGAEGKAARGLSYHDILAYYYGGLRPTPFSLPDTIRVGVAVGLESVTVQATGAVTVKGRSPGAGPWTVTGGTTLRVRHGAAPPSYITAGRITEAPTHLRAGRVSGIVTVAVPQLSVVRLVLRLPGPDIELTGPSTQLAGVAILRATVPEDVTAGVYHLQAVVTNGIDIARTPAMEIRVRGGPPSPAPSPTTVPSISSSPPAPPPRSAPEGGGGVGLIPVLAAVMAVGVVGTTVAVTWRRRRGQGPPAGPPAPPAG